MSDEHANDVTVHGYAKIVRAGLGSWSDEWIAEHAPTGRYAARVQKQRAALNALESQNQALQERIEELEAALDSIEYEVTVREQEDHLPSVECAGASFHLNKVGSIARNALSPTQETDPPGYNRFMTARDEANEPDYLKRPTQETDPE